MSFYSKNPKLLMEELAFQAALLDLDRDRRMVMSKPGEFIMKLPKEVRETLANLKSDHVRNSRPYI